MSGALMDLTCLANSVELSPVDRTGIVGLFLAFLAAAATAIKWVHPHVSNWIKSQTALANSVAHNSDSFQVMARVLVSLQASVIRNRRLMLLIEDSPTSIAKLRGICVDLIARYRMEFVDALTIADGIQYLPDARVLVLDIGLPDSTPAKLNALIQMAPCPVVIYSADAYTHKDFPGVTYFLRKSDQTTEIKRVIECAITGQPAFAFQGSQNGP